MIYLVFAIAFLFAVGGMLVFRTMSINIKQYNIFILVAVYLTTGELAVIFFGNILLRFFPVKSSALLLLAVLLAGTVFAFLAIRRGKWVLPKFSWHFLFKSALVAVILSPPCYALANFASGHLDQEFELNRHLLDTGLPLGATMSDGTFVPITYHYGLYILTALGTSLLPENDCISFTLFAGSFGVIHVVSWGCMVFGLIEHLLPERGTLFKTAAFYFIAYFGGNAFITLLSYPGSSPSWFFDMDKIPRSYYLPSGMNPFTRSLLTEPVALHLKVWSISSVHLLLPYLSFMIVHVTSKIGEEKREYVPDTGIFLVCLLIAVSALISEATFVFISISFCAYFLLALRKKISLWRTLPLIGVMLVFMLLVVGIQGGTLSKIAGSLGKSPMAVSLPAIPHSLQEKGEQEGKFGLSFHPTLPYYALGRVSLILGVKQVIRDPGIDFYIYIPVTFVFLFFMLKKGSQRSYGMVEFLFMVAALSISATLFVTFDKGDYNCERFNYKELTAMSFIAAYLYLEQKIFPGLRGKTGKALWIAGTFILLISFTARGVSFYGSTMQKELSTYPAYCASGIVPVTPK